MSRELTDADVIPLLREVIDIERKVGETWVWLRDGRAIRITSSWRASCTMVLYSAEEANREQI